MQLNAAHGFGGTTRYFIEREIGQGGMGVVYQAFDRESQVRVALKALSQVDAINIYRLKNEFRQLADLSHPNLVSLHELCNEGDWWFFTMELVEGKSFDEYVAEVLSVPPPPRLSVRTAKNGRTFRDVSVTLSQPAIGSEFPLPHATCNVDRLRLCLRQLVEAVAALHNAGKLHRDLKPSNVLVTPTGRVVVLDFGLVSSSTIVEPESQRADHTVGGCVFGTPAYMSPEQAAGEAITTASDWYSVGAMLYEGLTGQLPFDGTVLEILKQKESYEPVPPGELVAGVPDDLDQLCRDLLRRDPESRPSGAEILRSLTGHSDPPPVLDAQSTVHSRQGELFIGRESHLKELRAAFERSRDGRPVAVFLSGISGMGKSALARCFANELIRNDEAVVLRGRCYERETVPYKAFDNIIDALSRYLMRLPAEQTLEILPRNVHSLARLFPVLKRVKAVAAARRPLHQTNDPRELRKQAFNALKDLLLRITDYQPLVLQIDDLQWADMDSARLLSHLFGSSDPPPVLLVGAYRRDEAKSSPFLQYLLKDRKVSGSAADFHEISVDALLASEARALASELLRDQPTANALFSDSIASESDGVPFFITELVQHVRARTQRGNLPTSLSRIALDDVVRERISSMADESQRVLEVLSVAARPLEQAVALAASGLPSGDRTPLLALRAARLVRTRGTRQTDLVETYHDRVRETVVASMDVESVRLVHQELANALSAWRVDDPERLVDHYSAAGDGVRAGETAVQAAHAAADKLAFNRAAELYKKALEFAPHDTVQTRDLLERLGNALANSGRAAQATKAYLRAAAEAAEPATGRRLRRLAAQQCLRSGRLEEGMELGAELLEATGLSFPKNTTVALTGLLCNRARLRMTSLDFRPRETVASRDLERLDILGALYQELSPSDPLRGAYLHSVYLRTALRTGDPGRILPGLAWEVFHLTMRGGARNERRAREVIQRLEDLAEQLDTPYALATLRMAQAACCLFTGRYEEGLEPAREASHIFRASCKGVDWERNLVDVFRYSCLEFTGNLAEMTQEAAERARDATERDDHYSAKLLVMSAANAYLASGDPAKAEQVLDEQRSLLGSGFTTFHSLVMHRTADTLLYQGQGAAALRYELSQWPALTGSQLYRSRFMRAVSHCSRARCAFASYVETGKREELEVAQKDIAIVRRLGFGYEGFVSGLEASMATHQGNNDKACTLMRQAIREFERDRIGRGVLYGQRRLGALLGGTKGAELLSAADAKLRAQGIVDPERWVASRFGPPAPDSA